MSFEQCPFSFEFPNYGALQKTKRKKGEKEYDCWFDIYIEQFDARVHCSYSSISSQEQLEKSIEDAFLIAGKVNERSDFMEEVEIKNKQGAEGLLMRFEGPAASPAHFYLTDQKQHFLKASLYFNTQINPDSLAPINLFLMEDIARMIETFEWKG